MKNRKFKREVPMTRKDYAEMAYYAVTSVLMVWLVVEIVKYI